MHLSGCTALQSSRLGREDSPIQVSNDRYEPALTSPDVTSSDACVSSRAAHDEPCCSHANARPCGVAANGRIRRSGTARAQQRHAVGLRRQGHHRRRRHGRARLGHKSNTQFLGTAARRRKAARAEPRRARAAFLAKRSRLHERRLETREDGRDARYKTGRARVCATL